MLYELTTGLRPFIEAEEEMFTPAGHKSIMSRAGDVHYIKHNVLSQQRVGHLTPELKDLLAKMFVKEPSERITMNGVRHCLLRRMLRCSSPYIRMREKYSMIAASAS
jgi:serine/threonine protein kinase